MNETTLSTAFGVSFALVGGATVWLMLQATARMKQKGASARLIQAHRAGGYIFIALFGLMTYYMIRRLADMHGEASALPLVHMLLAVVLVPLIFVKVLIARYYKAAFYSALLPLGLIIYSIGFVLVAITAGPYLLRRATVEDIPLESVAMGTQKIDVDAAQLLTQDRCVKCHNLDRVFGARKDARGWLDTVNRMRSYPGSSISADDGRTIIAYLVSRVGVDDSTPQGEDLVGKSLVDSRCDKCHDLQQVYRSVKTPDEWKTTVARMQTYAPAGHFKPGEPEQIVAYLSATLTPDAKRAAAPAAPPPPTVALADMTGGGAKRSNTTLYVFGAIVLAVIGLLLFRRPGGGPPPAPPAGRGPQPGGSPPAASRGKTTLELRLARVEQRTGDAKTFRFVVPQRSPFAFSPGQFLTFNWMIDGQKVVRSYSISSSPTQAGLVEITVKRVPDGVVSVFLNDRAEPGLTVEAKGPAGKFVFDEGAHSSIVLIAAGSGITPMMSILRWIDDRCLTTDVTLVYGVRTPGDAIFGGEIEALAARMPRFRYRVIPTRPPEGWSRPSGRLTRDMLAAEIGDPSGKMYFLCGPAGFMESVREILGSLGVADSRILQERFGGKPASGPPPAGAIEGRAVFAQSGVEADVPEGATLLEVAEMNGVAIPFSCRQGQCGTCATRLVDGEVTMDAEDGLDATLRADGFVLTCVGRAHGDVTLDA